MYYISGDIMRTIRVSDELWEKLILLKISKKKKTIDLLIKGILNENNC